MTTYAYASRRISPQQLQTTDHRPTSLLFPLSHRVPGGLSNVCCKKLESEVPVRSHSVSQVGY